MSLAIAANTEMLPVLHPSHHSTGSALTLQKAKDYVKQIRQARQRQGYLILTLEMITLPYSLEKE